jgi:hypothetical protein
MEEFQIVRKDGDNYVISERSTRPPTWQHLLLVICPGMANGWHLAK